MLLLRLRLLLSSSLISPSSSSPSSFGERPLEAGVEVSADAIRGAALSTLPQALRPGTARQLPSPSSSALCPNGLGRRGLPVLGRLAGSAPQLPRTPDLSRRTVASQFPLLAPPCCSSASRERVCGRRPCPDRHFPRHAGRRLSKSREDEKRAAVPAGICSLLLRQASPRVPAVLTVPSILSAVAGGVGPRPGSGPALQPQT